MRTKPVTRFFVILVAGVAVVEHPPCVLGAARLVNKAPDRVLFTFPESTNTALFFVLPPEFGINMTLLVKRGDEIVTMSWRTGGEFLRSCQLKPDVLKGSLRFHGDLVLLFWELRVNLRELRVEPIEGFAVA